MLSLLKNLNNVRPNLHLIYIMNLINFIIQFIILYLYVQSKTANIIFYKYLFSNYAKKFHRFDLKLCFSSISKYNREYLKFCHNSKTVNICIRFI